MATETFYNADVHTRHWNDIPRIEDVEDGEGGLKWRVGNTLELEPGEEVELDPETLPHLYPTDVDEDGNEVVSDERVFTDPYLRPVSERPVSESRAPKRARSTSVSSTKGASSTEDSPDPAGGDPGADPDQGELTPHG